MQMIYMKDARKILRDVGVPENVIESVTLSHFIPEKVISYTLNLWAHGMREEQIAIILRNSMATANILNVRRFFRELGPLAARFGFFPERIDHDIAEFDSDMEKYACELIGVRKVRDICQNPALMVVGVDMLMDLCGAGNGKYYRAGVEFVEWCKIAYKTNEYVASILKKCINQNGVNIKRLLRLTTGYPGYSGNSIVSRADGDTIKPKIYMKNIKYANEVFRFFAANTDKIHEIAKKYSGIDFMLSFYEICMDWPGWSFMPIPKKPSVPDYEMNLRDAVAFIMWLITDGLPIDVRKTIQNTAVHEFVKIVPSATYEAPWQEFVRKAKSTR